MQVVVKDLKQYVTSGLSSQASSRSRGVGRPRERGKRSDTALFTVKEQRSAASAQAGRPLKLKRSSGGGRGVGGLTAAFGRDQSPSRKARQPATDASDGAGPCCNAHSRHVVGSSCETAVEARLC